MSTYDYMLYKHMYLGTSLFPHSMSRMSNFSSNRNFNFNLQSEPEFRPPMSEVVQDLLDIIRRERPSNESIGD